jgi:hypothetical protein
MPSNNETLIAVVGATGQQGGAVLRALQAGTRFLLPGAYLPGFGFVRPNCARKQNSRQAAEQVVDVGTSECPGDPNVTEGLMPSTNVKWRTHS